MTASVITVMFIMLTAVSCQPPEITAAIQEPEEQYLFLYRAVSDVGVSEASNSVPFKFHRKHNVRVGESWDFSMPSLFNELRTKIMTNIGMSRWSPSDIKSEFTNVVYKCCSPSIPYFYTIPRGLRAGMALYIQGVVFAADKSFILDLQTGLKDDDNIAFHFRMDDWITCDSRRNGKWEKQERTPGRPVPIGSAFDIFIVTKTEDYVVYINGQRTLLFKHRMPMEKVTTLQIQGDVIVNTVGIVENWHKSTFGKELNSAISRTKVSDIQFHVPYPFCNPSRPYLGKIPGGLRPGVALFFQGVVPSDCERFSINLLTGPTINHDIAFHFNPRMDSVVLNSRRNGDWGNEVVIQGGPFVKGGAFDIIMVIKPEDYKVIVNGLEYCTFSHRIPVDEVTALSVEKDVFMNIISIIEVDYVNLKVTIPANI